MFYKKISIVLYTIILFSEIISVTIASYPDCDILAKAFEHLKGNFLQNFLTRTPCCNHYQLVRCGGGQVIEVFIDQYSNSEADFKSAIEELTEIKSLTSLIIKDTSSAHGVVIPESISKLKYLKKLDISNNISEDAVLSIPDAIGNLTNLEELNLSNNNLVGAIPKSFKNLKKLKILDLSKNNLSGTIPYEISEFDNIGEIYLNDNKELNGYVPLTSNIYDCKYSNTNLCYLKDTDCKSSIPKCTAEDIKNINNENGAPSLSTYENQSYSDNTGKIILVAIYLIIIIAVLICLAVKYIHRHKRFKPVLLYVNNTNSTNTNYKPTPASNTTINNIYNFNESSSPEDPPPYSSISSGNTSYYQNHISSQPLIIPSAAYTPSAPEKY